MLSICMSGINAVRKEKPAPRDAGLEAISAQTVEAHLAFLASDALQGREAGKTGGLVAAEYIRATLKASGVQPFYNSYFQPFEAFSPAREQWRDFEVHPDSVARFKQLSAYRKLSLQNVIGSIEGRRKDEFVVVGAHFDHVGVDELLVGDRIYNGADDNAASVAALLQVAQAFVAAGQKPERTIIFAFWDGEEVNYLGSEYFVENFGETDSIKAYVNLDMIGREGLLPTLYPQFEIPQPTEENTASGRQFHFVHTEELATTADALQKTFIARHLDIVPKPAVIQHGSRGSDFLPFSRRRIPILWFFTGLHPDYHTPADEASTVNLDKLTEITKAVYLSVKIWAWNGYE